MRRLVGLLRGSARKDERAGFTGPRPSFKKFRRFGWDLHGCSRQPAKPSMSPGRSRWWARTAHARHDFDGAPGPTSTKPVMDSKRPSLPTMPKSVPTKWVGASSVPPASHVKRTRSLWASTTLASRKR
jgi:hypothetical protein